MKHRMQMVMRYLAVALVWLIVVCPAEGQALRSADRYSSDAEKLFVLARDLWAPVELAKLGYLPEPNDTEESAGRVRQACLFLEAAIVLNEEYELARQDLTMLYMADAISDPGRATDALLEYTARNTKDGVPIMAWLEYMLGQKESVGARENFLNQNMPGLNQYTAIQSIVLRQLGHLALERGDIKAAGDYFQQAHQIWRFAYGPMADYMALPEWKPQRDPLVEVSEEDIAKEEADAKAKLSWYRRMRWRANIRSNPSDLEATLNLIEALDEMGQHGLAQKYYPHAYTLLEIQEDREAAEESLKELRARELLSVFSAGDHRACVLIGERALMDDPDAFVVNALLGRSLAQLGITDEAQRCLARATKRIGLQNAGPPEMARPGWFYCFIDQRPGEAVKYSREQVAADPNDELARATLAYALALQGELDDAADLLPRVDPNEVVAALAWAKVEVARGNPIEALRRLRPVAREEQGLLAGELTTLVDDLLAQIGADAALQALIQPKDYYLVRPQRNGIAEQFEAMFNDAELEIIKAPEKTFHYTLTLTKKTDVFNYGQPIMAELLLSNLSDTEISLGPDSMLDPHVLIVAEVTPVDGVNRVSGAQQTAASATTQVFPIAHRYLLEQQSLRRGRRNKMSEMLNIGPLREILEEHPQQTYQVTFRSYLDPVSDEQGGFNGRIPAIQPNPLTITRKAFVPTEQHMWFQYNLLENGTPDERVGAAHLAGGLLREAQLARKGLLRYNVRRINEAALRELLVENLKHEDFRVRAWSAYAFVELPISAGSPEGQQLAELLADEHWLVRFMAAQTLEPLTDMGAYLRWARIDKSEVVRRQAQLMAGEPWEVIEMPEEEVADPNEVPEKSDLDELLGL